MTLWRRIPLVLTFISLQVFTFFSLFTEIFLHGVRPKSRVQAVLCTHYLQLAATPLLGFHQHSHAEDVTQYGGGVLWMHVILSVSLPVPLTNAVLALYKPVQYSQLHKFNNRDNYFNPNNSIMSCFKIEFIIILQMVLKIFHCSWNLCPRWLYQTGNECNLLKCVDWTWFKLYFTLYCAAKWYHCTNIIIY